MNIAIEIGRDAIIKATDEGPACPSRGPTARP